MKSLAIVHYDQKDWAQYVFELCYKKADVPRRANVAKAGEHEKIATTRVKFVIFSEMLLDHFCSKPEDSFLKELRKLDAKYCVGLVFSEGEYPTKSDVIERLRPLFDATIAQWQFVTYPNDDETDAYMKKLLGDLAEQHKQAQPVPTPRPPLIAPKPKPGPPVEPPKPATPPPVHKRRMTPPSPPPKPVVDVSPNTVTHLPTVQEQFKPERPPKKLQKPAVPEPAPLPGPRQECRMLTARAGPEEDLLVYINDARVTAESNIRGNILDKDHTASGVTLTPSSLSRPELHVYYFRLPGAPELLSDQFCLQLVCDGVELASPLSFTYVSTLEALANVLNRSLMDTPVGLMCAALEIARSPQDLDAALAATFSSSYSADMQQLFAVAAANGAQAQKEKSQRLEHATMLHFAAKYDLEKLCLAVMDSPNAWHLFDVKNRDGRTPVEVAVNQDHQGLADCLSNYQQQIDYENLYVYLHAKKEDVLNYIKDKYDDIKKYANVEIPVPLKSKNPMYVQMTAEDFDTYKVSEVPDDYYTDMGKYPYSKVAGQIQSDYCSADPADNPELPARTRSMKLQMAKASGQPVRLSAAQLSAPFPDLMHPQPQAGWAEEYLEARAVQNALTSSGGGGEEAQAEDGIYYAWHPSGQDAPAAAAAAAAATGPTSPKEHKTKKKGGVIQFIGRKFKKMSSTANLAVNTVNTATAVSGTAADRMSIASSSSGASASSGGDPHDADNSGDEEYQPIESVTARPGGLRATRPKSQRPKPPKKR